MDADQRFYQRPWFSPFLWTIFGLGFYAWQILRLGGLRASLIYMILDSFFFGGLMVVWLAFFAQFVLPVHRFRERQKIFDRLVSYLFGLRGPAIFVKDGVSKFGRGEKERTGAGVIWLDSASAVQLRTISKFTRVLGPGVHFTNSGESIAGAVDLHLQAQGIGPQAKDRPFDPKPEEMSDDEYNAIQKRRGETSALTRDGIEVVPNINVIFKIDAEPVEGDDMPGSRFADIKPVRNKEGKIVEETNPVFKAIAGEGINPNLLDKPLDKQLVAWNKLPAIIAADLWREYLSKFTLRDLFLAAQDIPPEEPPPLQPALHETTALYEPVKASPPQNAWQDAIAEILHEINRTLRGWTENLEKDTALKPASPAAPKPPPPFTPGKPRKGTALDVIGAMMRARMTQEKADKLDSNGQRVRPEGADKFEQEESPEYKLLKSRGLKVIGVSVSNLRFTKAVEDQMVSQWETSWLGNAKAEHDGVERLRKIAELQGREKALRDYAGALGKGLDREKIPQGKDALTETVRNLIMRTRSLIYRNTRLHRHLSTEIHELDEILKWMER